MLESFTQFAQSILGTGEGIFWSMERSEIGGKACHWTTELRGELATDQLKDGFIITDWKGEKVSTYSFNKVDNGPQGKLSNNEIENFWASLPVVSLDLDPDLSRYLIEDGEGYKEKVKTIQKAQRDGEMWVMNLATELTGQLDNLSTEQRLILALKSYYHLLKSGKAHCGGVVWMPGLQCVSFSPEVFIHQVDPHIVKTFPIKGTGDKAYLAFSEKEISELYMVTDLLRNDLGMMAEKVSVPRERFLTDEGHFYHAQSEIEAVLENQFLTLEQLKIILPPGSMTGCPKHRVCQYIKKLEAFNRHFYSGAFGVRRGGAMTLGLLIRTFFFGERHWYYPVGAGITVESDPQKESQEILEKARVLLDFFNH